jgi:hypothetical protein
MPASACGNRKPAELDAAILNCLMSQLGFGRQAFEAGHRLAGSFEVRYPCDEPIGRVLSCIF